MEISPDVHIYTRSKRDFVSIVDGKPAFEAFYGSRKGVYRDEAMQRFEKILPAINEYRTSRGLKETK